MSPIPGDNRQTPHHSADDDLSVSAMDANVIIAGSSSDSAGEDEDNEQHGYQMLAQDVDDVMDTEGATLGDHDDDDDDDIDDVTDEGSVGSKPSHTQVPDISNSEAEDRRSIWNESRLHPGEPMDDDHMSKIKAAMSGFQLPGCQVPTWARVVSEDDWKTQLLSRLHSQKSQINSQPSSSQHTTDHEDPPNKRVKCTFDDTDSRPDSEEETNEETITETQNETEER